MYALHINLSTLTYMYFPVYTIGDMDKYLSVTEVADRTGLALNTVKAYSQIPGRLPEADVKIGRVKGWKPETIDAWMKGRK